MSVLNGIIYFYLGLQTRTYVSQVTAPFDGAMRKWAETYDFASIEALDDDDERARLIQDISSDSPTTVDGLESVWCISAMIRNELALIHVVKTELSGVVDK